MNKAIVSSYGRDYMVATLRPSRRQYQIALGFISVLVTVTFVVVCFGNLQLQQIEAAVPAFAVAMLISDSLTAFLLFAQFSVLKSRALLVLSSGYLYAGLIMIPWALTFPGDVTSNGLLGAGLQTTGWLYTFWNAGFPLFGLIYALLSRDGLADDLWSRSTGRAISCSVFLVAVIICGVTILTTAGQGLLPSLAVSALYLSRAWVIPLSFTIVVSAITAALLVRRKDSILDLWLTVVIVTYFLRSVIGLSSFSRFTVSWYCERAFALTSANMVLFALLYETASLYVQLFRANAMLASERENRLMNIDAIAAAVTHEVKQPLTALSVDIFVAREFLGKVPPDISKARASLDDANQCVLGTTEALDGIRSLLRADDKARQSINLNEVIRYALHTLSGELEHHEVSVHYQLAPDLPLIEGNRGQLQQVVLNLVHNAVEAMGSTTNQRRLLALTTVWNDDAIVLEVQDTGPGIEITQLASIFGAFVTTKTHGMGLGLAISRAIVERHGGQLSASSDGATGASFKVVLPITFSQAS
jgi:signal transduction histidine kinase